MTTTTRTRFTVPVYPHVKKFILKQYNLSEPVRTEEYKSLGKLVTLSLLDRRPHAEFNDQYRDRLKANLVICLTKEQSKLSPRLSKLMRINIHIDVLFKEHLLVWINSLGQDGIAPYTACRIFLEYYGIDENEYSLDAAYKYFQRTKSKEG